MKIDMEKLAGSRSAAVGGIYDLVRAGKKFGGIPPGRANKLLRELPSKMDIDRHVRWIPADRPTAGAGEVFSGRGELVPGIMGRANRFQGNFDEFQEAVRAAAQKTGWGGARIATAEDLAEQAYRYAKSGKRPGWWGKQSMAHKAYRLRHPVYNWAMRHPVLTTAGAVGVPYTGYRGVRGAYNYLNEPKTVPNKMGKWVSNPLVWGGGLLTLLLLSSLLMGRGRG